MNTNTPWSEYLQNILDTGMTQHQVAAHVGCCQAVVSAIFSGKTTDPHYSIGIGLVVLGRKRRVKGIPTNIGIVRSRKK